MKIKYNTKAILMIGGIIILALAASSIKAQNDYTVNWGDTSTYKVTCGKVITSKWSVKNDSCTMTTPFIRVEANEGSEVIYTFKVNQSGNGEASDRCWVYHSTDDGVWILDTMFYAGGTPRVFTYSDHVFMSYTHFVRFKICMKTDSNTEFWSISGGDLNITDGYPAMQKIMAYSTKPPAPLLGPETLPVELMSFNGQVADDMVKLDWATASETNNDYYTIEKSVDGVAYEPIGFVAGAGTSNIMNQYVYYDDNPDADIYYRLKQTDFDGAFEYLGITTAQSVASDESDIQISCAGDIINLQTNTYKCGPMHVSIYDLSGKQIYSTSITVDRNQSSYNIKPVNNFGSLCLVSVNFDNKTPHVGKVYLK